jgi:competence protein ComGC
MVVVMNNRGYTGKELLIVIMVMGVLTMLIIGSTSNAFKDKTGDYYNEIEHAIEKQAVLYGNTLDNLKEEGHLMITLDDVINAGYFIANEDGNVVDPRNSKNTLNGIKIKLTYKNDKVIAEVIDEE